MVALRLDHCFLPIFRTNMDYYDEQVHGGMKRPFFNIYSKLSFISRSCYLDKLTSLTALYSLL